MYTPLFPESLFFLPFIYDTKFSDFRFWRSLIDARVAGWQHQSVSCGNIERASSVAARSTKWPDVAMAAANEYDVVRPPKVSILLLSCPRPHCPNNDDLVDHSTSTTNCHELGSGHKYEVKVTLSSSHPGC